MRVLLILFSSCIMAITGCSSCPDAKMLPGKYYYSHNGVIRSQDSIFIYSDRTYKYKVPINDEEVFENNGKWEFDSVGCEILFKDFTPFWASADGLPPGNWFSKVQVVDGEVRLMYSSEDNIYYAKTELLLPKSEKVNIVKEYSGTGSKVEELSLTGVATILNLSYNFYIESDQLTVEDQDGKELFSTGMIATNGIRTKEIPLRGITKLVFKVKGSQESSKWKVKAEIK